MRRQMLSVQGALLKGLTLVALMVFSPLIRHVNPFHVLRSHFNVAKAGDPADGFWVEGSEGFPVDLIQSIGRGPGVSASSSDDIPDLKSRT